MNQGRIAQLAVAAAALLAACGPKTMQARLDDGERVADRATFLLSDGERAMERGDLERSEGLIAEAEQALAHPDVETNPEEQLLLERMGELKSKVAAAKQEESRAVLQDKLAARRMVIESAMAVFREAKAAFAVRPHNPRLKRQMAVAAKQARDDIDWDREVTQQDVEFTAYLDELKAELNGASATPMPVALHPPTPATPAEIVTTEVAAKPRALPQADTAIEVASPVRVARASETGATITLITPLKRKPPHRRAGSRSRWSLRPRGRRARRATAKR
jgi:hypothetical protein